MAGSYPDAPSDRFAFDADGTIGIHRETSGAGVVAEIAGSNLIIMNNESENSWTYDGGIFRPEQYLGLIFPELRDLDGVFYAYSNGGTPAEVDTSADTTNGVDGTWDQQIADFANWSVVAINYRDEIETIATIGSKSIRINTEFVGGGNDRRVRAFHIYGTIGAGETPDRILFLDTENSDAVFTKVLDFGDVPRGQTSTRTFKLKNNSSSFTINTINVTAEDLHLNAGNWYEFGSDGIGWESTYTVGNMANGAEELVHMKQEIPVGETLSLQAARIKVTHASLT